MLKGLKYLVVGAGFSGAVIAERIASVLNEKVLVIEKRRKPGGNSASAIDTETGIECHSYGSHIFHTSNTKVWDYIQQFSVFTDYRHRVLIRCGNKVFFMPVNLKTLHDFYAKDFTPETVKTFLADEISASGIVSPANLEEKAISLIGEPLYRTFIAGYTQKQWGRSPRELPAEIITRLPVRMNYNTDYFNDSFQGVPRDGYFTLFNRILKNPNIEIKLNTSFQNIKKEIPPDCKIIYTGMIDEFFENRLGSLEWRSLRFEWATLSVCDFQGTAVMNYGDAGIPYTRIHEFKHYHPERKEPFTLNKTVICREYPHSYKNGEEAYYPVNDEKNQKLLRQYQDLAAGMPNVLFCGRLGCYCYWDMDKAIGAALDCFENKIKKQGTY